MIKKLTGSTIAVLTMMSLFNTSGVYAQENQSEEIVKEARVTVNHLNVRSGPTAKCSIIDGYKLNESIDLVSVKDGWYKIKLEDGKTGWTNGRYITLDGEISVKALNVRSGPSTAYDIIQTEGKQTVKILKTEDNGWYKIKLDDGKIGYVCGKYVETEAENLHNYDDLSKLPKGYSLAKDSNDAKSSEKKSSKSSETKSSSSSKKKSSSSKSYNTSKKSSYNKSSKKSSSSSKKSSSKPSYSGRTMTVSATAYSGDGITSTGRKPQVGRTIAVDPRVIPYGTKVYIPSLGETYVAEDCGGGIKGNRIDIFMGSESQCNSWGVRSIKIQILD